jgi:hypothetical protein
MFALRTRRHAANIPRHKGKPFVGILLSAYSESYEKPGRGRGKKPSDYSSAQLMSHIQPFRASQLKHKHLEVLKKKNATIPFLDSWKTDSMKIGKWLFLFLIPPNSPLHRMFELFLVFRKLYIMYTFLII